LEAEGGGWGRNGRGKSMRRRERGGKKGRRGGDEKRENHV